VSSVKHVNHSLSKTGQ